MSKKTTCTSSPALNPLGFYDIKGMKLNQMGEDWFSI